jgi:hypothetical protein
VAALVRSAILWSSRVELIELELETEVKTARKMTSTTPTVSNFEEFGVFINFILFT